MGGGEEGAERRREEEEEEERKKSKKRSARQLLSLVTVCAFARAPLLCERSLSARGHRDERAPARYASSCCGNRPLASGKALDRLLCLTCCCDCLSRLALQKSRFLALEQFK